MLAALRALLKKAASLIEATFELKGAKQRHECNRPDVKLMKNSFHAML